MPFFLPSQVFDSVDSSIGTSDNQYVRDKKKSMITDKDITLGAPEFGGTERQSDHQQGFSLTSEISHVSLLNGTSR